jgi:formate hydrogenlyase transcriptional activator
LQAEAAAGDRGAGATGPTLAAMEREHIIRTLVDVHWVVGGPRGAAARLGLKRSTLVSRMQKLGITRPGS